MGNVIREHAASAPSRAGLGAVTGQPPPSWGRPLLPPASCTGDYASTVWGVVDRLMLLCDHPYTLVRVKLASDRLRWWDAMRFHSFLVLELQADRPRDDHRKAYARLDWGAEGASLVGLVSHELPLLGFEQGGLELATALLCCASMVQAIIVERFFTVGSMAWITADDDLSQSAGDVGSRFELYKGRFQDGRGFWICQALTPLIVLLFFAAMSKSTTCSRCLIAGVYWPIVFLSFGFQNLELTSERIAAMFTVMLFFLASLPAAFCAQRWNGVKDVLRGSFLSTLVWIWNRAVQFSGLMFIEPLDHSASHNGDAPCSASNPCQPPAPYSETNLFNMLLPLPVSQLAASAVLLGLCLRRLRAIRVRSCAPAPLQLTTSSRADHALIRFLFATIFPLGLQLYYGFAVLKGMLGDEDDGGRDIEQAVLGPFTFGALEKAPRPPTMTVVAICSIVIGVIMFFLTLLLVAGLREVIVLWKAAAAFDFIDVPDEENSLGRLTSHLSRVAAGNKQYDIAEFNCGHFSREVLGSITGATSECSAAESSESASAS